MRCAACSVQEGKGSTYDSAGDALTIPALLLLLRCTQAVAILGPGSWFGGGAAIYGSGPVQSALRVVAKGGRQRAHQTDTCTLTSDLHPPNRTALPYMMVPGSTSSCCACSRHVALLTLGPGPWIRDLCQVQTCLMLKLFPASFWPYILLIVGLAKAARVLCCSSSSLMRRARLDVLLCCRHWSF